MSSANLRTEQKRTAWLSSNSFTSRGFDIPIPIENLKHSNQVSSPAALAGFNKVCH